LLRQKKYLEKLLHDGAVEKHSGLAWGRFHSEVRNMLLYEEDQQHKDFRQVFKKFVAREITPT
jgi:muramoyltetrapeptide carboxypeptidase LdcA involved in peptidoglycan recycling